MIGKNIIRRLKQSNVSKYPAKTKDRVNKLWKTASRSQKKAIEQMAGTSRATIYRVYKKGNISAKLVVPMAMIFNVNPYYISGDSEEIGCCTDEIVMEYISKLGYGEMAENEIEKEKRRLTKEKIEKAREEAGMDSNFVLRTAVSRDDADFTINADDLTLEELQLLMHSMLIRERAGIEPAVENAAKLRALLLS